MIIDHENNMIYACVSERTSLSVLEKYASANKYQAIVFLATDKNGMPVYHTNVMMCVADDYAVVCLESIKDKKERDALLASLQPFSGVLAECRRADEQRRGEQPRTQDLRVRPAACNTRAKTTGAHPARLRQRHGDTAAHPGWRWSANTPDAPADTRCRRGAGHP